MQNNVKYSIATWRRSGVRIAATIVVALSGVVFLSAQKSASPQPPKTNAAPTPAPSPQILPPIQLDGSAVLAHLNQLINWYRHSTTGIQPAGLPSDAIYQDNTKNLGSQAIGLAFQSARAEAALIAAQQKNGASNQPSAETTQQQNLAQLQAKTSAQIDQLQSQIESVNSQIAKTVGPSQSQSHFSAGCSSGPTGTAEGAARRRSKDVGIRRDQRRDFRRPRR